MGERIGEVIALSSFRPLDESAEYKANQLRARASWDNVFSAIAYFNRCDDRINGSNVYFINDASVDPPNIGRLMQLAADYAQPPFSNGWACIVNADIVILKRFKLVQQALYSNGAKCAISRRFEYDPNDLTKPGKNCDLGIDIFCAKAEVWGRAAKECPPHFTMGKQRWDCWTLAFFMENWPNECWDFSRAGVILHPRHGDRKDQSCEPPKDGRVEKMMWPHKMLAI